MLWRKKKNKVEKDKKKKNGRNMVSVGVERKEKEGRKIQPKKKMEGISCQQAWEEKKRRKKIKKIRNLVYLGLCYFHIIF